MELTVVRKTQGLVLVVTAPLTADEVIAHLKLGPHPEGGYFRETFRGAGTVTKRTIKQVNSANW
jgi:predicted cupin superfamily sugar epimerase